MNKHVFRVIKVLIIVYCLVGIACYYCQDWLLMHPKSVPAGTRYEFKTPFTEVTIPYNAETNINIVQFHSNPTFASGKPAGPGNPSNLPKLEPDSPGNQSNQPNPKPDSAGSQSNLPSPSAPTPGNTAPKGLVLYFHGNQDGVSHYARYAADFTSRGYDVWMIDYPGFGKSTGKFTEANVYQYALQEYLLARKQFTPLQIIIYGKSLGTGIASQLATIRDCRRLILETPYYSLPAMCSSWLPVYPWNSMLHFKFPNYEYLPKVTAPITLFHGDHDRIIPHRQSSRLANSFKAGDQLITIPNAGHNDCAASKIYQQALDTLLK